MNTEIEEPKSDILPENSKSLEIQESTSRFSSAIWFEKIQQQKILIAGIGGIGSYVAFLLSRMRPLEICVYDSDTVELVNMSGQLFSIRDVEKAKVAAISDIMRNFSLYNSTICIPEKFTEDCPANDIMICGFDNMEARKTFFESWLNHVIYKSSIEEREKCIFIDGRLAAEELQVFCITGGDFYNISKYKDEFLFDSSEAEATLCSYKQTSFMANMIGSIIANLFVNFIANQCEGLLLPRDLPFYTEYNAETMHFKTLN